LLLHRRIYKESYFLKLDRKKKFQEQEFVFQKFKTEAVVEFEIHQMLIQI